MHACIKLVCTYSLMHYEYAHTHTGTCCDADDDVPELVVEDGCICGVYWHAKCGVYTINERYEYAPNAETLGGRWQRSQAGEHAPVGVRNKVKGALASRKAQQALQAVPSSVDL